jgi:hypothetical protein
VDVVKSDAVEAEYLTGETDIYKAAKFFADMGPKEIVLTHKDGLLIYATVNLPISVLPVRLDGRGRRSDTCIGTYVAMRLSRPPRRLASGRRQSPAKMEDLGPLTVQSRRGNLDRARYNHGTIL